MTEAEFHERWATYWRDYARIKDQALVEMREELKSTRQQLREGIEALGRIAAGPHMDPHAEPWSKAEAMIGLGRIER
jgi:hypothetical protein